MVLAQPGDLLAGRYRLRGVIGRGGMGVVWVATDELLHRDVAIKETFRPPELDDSEWDVLRERSLGEARTAARLSHPNIVGMFDILEHDGRPWLVMQLVPFPSLRDVVKDSGPLSPAHAAQVGLSVLAAIRAAHSAGVLHRDIKPENVLLGTDNQVVLADFGLAVTDGSPHATRTGLIIGSPSYMSPERARGEPASPAADLWSLGATLYAAVEGRDPFERGSAAAVLAAVITDEPDGPSRAGPLWPVISELLRKDPQQRLTADHAWQMLQPVAQANDATYLAADNHTAVLAIPPYREPDSGRRRGRGLIAAVLAGVAAVALGGYLAAGALGGHHAPVPTVTQSISPGPTPSDVGASFGDHSKHKHHDHHHGEGNGNDNGGG